MGWTTSNRLPGRCHRVAPTMVTGFHAAAASHTVMARPLWSGLRSGCRRGRPLSGSGRIRRPQITKGNRRASRGGAGPASSAQWLVHGADAGAHGERFQVVMRIPGPLHKPAQKRTPFSSSPAGPGRQRRPEAVGFPRCRSRTVSCVACVSRLRSMIPGTWTCMRKASS